MRARAVSHCERERASPPGSYHGAMQGFLIGFSQIPGRFPQLTHQTAQFIGRRGGGLRSSKRDGRRIGDALRPFARESSVSETEDASPDSIEMDRNDRHGPSLHYAFEPSSEREERAGSGDLPFREDADDLAVVECLAGVAQRSENHTGPAGGRYRDDVHRGHQRFEQWVRGVGRIYDETNGPIDAGHEQEAVDERHVVGDEECSSGLRDMVLAHHTKPVQRVREDDEHQADECVGQQPECPQRAAHCKDSGDEEDAAR